ncbi:hypothetical protein CAC42_2971 [Sphaceloma murrayae]|uniref:non-specific serine/threonine protein kinase n=1 Tax=Sphaceloma murrayae TaxID=2082308 RepID=A0A2K1R0C5_9PEZI|nr:hypothetical protein CAC42_2971 [Sphaceloma murrayae]
MKSPDFQTRMLKKLAGCSIFGRTKFTKERREKERQSMLKRKASQSILKSTTARSDGAGDGFVTRQKGRHGDGRIVQFCDGSPESVSDEVFHADIDLPETPNTANYTVRRCLKRSKSADPETTGLNNFFHDFHIRKSFLRKKSRMPPIDTHSLIPKNTVNDLDAGTSSSPSSYDPSANSTSPASQTSTAPTSIFSTVGSVQSQTSPDVKPNSNPEVQDTHTTAIHKEPSLSPIRESSPSTQAASHEFTPGAKLPTETFSKAPVSVMTIEKAAAIKIYLETHFSKLLSSGPTDRSIRRRNFEHNLIANAFTDSQRLIARTEWYQAEAAHTRQMRVLKTTSLLRHTMKGIDIAGYEVVRVLGKGSFGVVRLVTEKRDASALTPLPHAGQGNSRTHSSAASSLKTLCPKDVYAMKVIRKSTMLRTSQEAHLRAERDFLASSAHSRWVVPLIAAFQDNTNLYLVMEYMVGGDFLGLLLREDVLDEAVARWYAAEMVLCVTEAHRLGWIHRDVKPDNFLIDARGHLRIGDFGLAFDGGWAHDQGYFRGEREGLRERCGVVVKGDEEDEGVGSVGRGRQAGGWLHVGGRVETDVLPRREREERRLMAKSIVGTGQYMAPEIILGLPYDGRCDWWSLGIILYECLFGRTPFYRESRQATKECIVRHEETLYFPTNERWSRPGSEYRRWLPWASELVLDLIRGLLCDREIRLGSRAYRYNEFKPGRLRHFGGGMSAHGSAWSGKFVNPAAAEEIKGHPWFLNVPWEHMHQMMPPFVPRLREGQSVTKYFEEEKSILLSDSSEQSSDVEPPLRVNDSHTEDLGDSLDGAKGEDRRGGQGQWLRRARLRREKEELGLQTKTDESFERLKRETGPYWECWKSARKMELEVKESDAGSSTRPVQPPSSATAASSTLVSPIDPADPFAGTRASAQKQGENPYALDGMATSPAAQHGDDNAALPPTSTHQGAVKATPTKRDKKPKHRAKDKILRDPLYTKEVMEVRKRTAFLGYTYRRMKGPEGWLADGGLIGLDVHVNGYEGAGDGMWNTGGMMEGGWGDMNVDGAGDCRGAGGRKKGRRVAGARKAKGRLWP